MIFRFFYFVRELENKEQVFLAGSLVPVRLFFVPAQKSTTRISPVSI